MAHSQLCLLSARKDRGSLPFSLYRRVTPRGGQVLPVHPLVVPHPCVSSHAPDGSENPRAGLQRAFSRAGSTSTHERGHRLRARGAVLGSLSRGTGRAAQGATTPASFHRTRAPPGGGVQAAGRLAIGAPTRPAADCSEERVPRSAMCSDDRFIAVNQVCFTDSDGTLSVAGEAVVCGVLRKFGMHASGTCAGASWLCSQVTCAQLAELTRRAERWTAAARAADACVSRVFLLPIRERGTAIASLTTKRMVFQHGSACAQRIPLRRRASSRPNQVFPRASLPWAAWRRSGVVSRSSADGRMVPVAFSASCLDIADSPLYRQPARGRGRIGRLQRTPTSSRVARRTAARMVRSCW